MIFNMLYYIFNKAGFAVLCAPSARGAVLSGKKDLNAELRRVFRKGPQRILLINCLGKISDNHYD